MSLDYIECIVSVNAIILYKDEILLQKVTKKNNTLGLPGGKVDKGETFEQALKREIWEETGIHESMYVYEKIAILHDSPDTTCKHIYVCHLKEKFNEFQFDIGEISECIWLKIDSIPEDISLYRNSWVFYVVRDYQNRVFRDCKKLYTLLSL